MEVFWEQGYAATSIGDLTRATGLSRSSLYQAFDSKRNLFGRVLERYLDDLGAMLAPLEDGEPGLDGITGFFNNWEQRLTHPDVDGTLGCLIVNTTTELAGRDGDLSSVATAYRERLLDGFRAALQRAQDRAEITPGRVEVRARMLVAGVMGVFVASRGNNNEDISQWIGAVRSQANSWRR